MYSTAQFHSNIKLKINKKNNPDKTSESCYSKYKMIFDLVLYIKSDFLASNQKKILLLGRGFT